MRDQPNSNDPFANGVPIDGDVLQNVQDFEAPGKYSRLQGGLEAVEQGFTEGGVISGLLEANKMRWFKAFNPGQRISYDDWKKSELYTPELDKEFKSGTNVNIAYLRYRQVESQRKRQDILDEMPEGVISSVDRGAGRLIGAALDPANLAAAMFLPELVGPSKLPFIAKLAESGTAGNLAARTASGGVIGGALTIPNSLSQLDLQQSMGQNADWYNMMANFGEGVGLGALLDGFGGLLTKPLNALRRVITRESADSALQTSVAQAAADKSVSVESVLNQGFNEERQMEAESSSVEERARLNEQVSKFNELSKSQLEENKAQLDAEKSKLDESLELQKQKEATTPSINKKDDVPTGQKLLDRLDHIDSKPQFSKTAEEVNLLRKLPNTPEMERLQSIRATPSFRRTGDDLVFLKKFAQGDESEMIKNRLEKHSTELEKINAKKKPDKQDLTRKDELINLLEEGQKRQQKLANVQPEPAHITALRDSISARQRYHDVLENAELSSKASLDLDNADIPEVTHADVREESDKVASDNSNLSRHPIVDERFDSALDAVEEAMKKQDEELERDIKTMRENGELNDEDEEILKKSDEIDSINSSLFKALRQWASCIKGE